MSQYWHRWSKLKFWCPRPLSLPLILDTFRDGIRIRSQPFVIRLWFSIVKHKAISNLNCKICCPVWMACCIAGLWRPSICYWLTHCTVFIIVAIAPNVVSWVPWKVFKIQRIRGVTQWLSHHEGKVQFEFNSCQCLKLIDSLPNRFYVSGDKPWLTVSTLE